jgi:hypothetical protein
MLFWGAGDVTDSARTVVASLAPFSTRVRTATPALYLLSWPSTNACALHFVISAHPLHPCFVYLACSARKHALQIPAPGRLERCLPCHGWTPPSSKLGWKELPTVPCLREPCDHDSRHLSSNSKMLLCSLYIKDTLFVLSTSLHHSLY